ncbi:hypothetical protein HN873_067746 [Arachis hypogaea]
MPSPSSSRLTAIISPSPALTSSLLSFGLKISRDKGRVVSEEEQAKENVYIKVSFPFPSLSPSPSSKADSDDFFVRRNGRERSEKQKQQAEKEIAEMIKQHF